MYIGVDYYPEHRSHDLWERDAQLMQEAGFNVVRMAEFAWVNMEPVESHLEFTWLDDSLQILASHGISAILGTPTAVMPAWVARKYPETLAMQTNGQRVRWGVRKNNCFTSGAYRLLSERITRAMAEHYVSTSNVIGWQTDNEFGGPVCYCDTCRGEFQDWLRSRYGTLDQLNAAWGTHFWGHRYGTWGEIQLPEDFGGHNPSLCLDWQRFNSWLNTRFQSDQVRILRTVCPSHFVTHNFMGLFSELNYYDLARDLDFVTWDNYPVGDGPSFKYDAATAADVMRGLKGMNFWIMEQTAGAPGWGQFGRNPRPGEIRQVAYQQLAHGADGQIWFRWDTCTAGREQYWHGLLGHDNKPHRRYHEAALVATEYRKLEPVLANTTIKADVAIIYDYESIWAFKIQPAYGSSLWDPSTSGVNNYQNAIRRYHRALLRAGVNVNMVAPSSDLSKYKVVFAPHLYILPDDLAMRLSEYVRTGGILICDGRTGVKDATSLMHARTLPGLLSDALGISIEEYEGLAGDTKYGVTGTDVFPGTYTAIQYADWVTARGADVLARVDEWHMRDFAALTRNHYGSGYGYYAGVNIKEEAFYDALVKDVMHNAGISPVVAPPPGVEVSVREGDGRKVLFLINHTEQPITISVPAGKSELIGGTRTNDTLTLERYGVAAIQLL
jgi:beta-galactosidase